MAQITELTVEELKKRRGLLLGLVIVMLISFVGSLLLTIGLVQQDHELTGIPTFYSLIFLPIIMGIALNSIMKIRKEILSRDTD
ncbi:MAG: hypothetical protein ACI9P5_004555 [Saprospiraceae bacterium]|jgi:hypothetical protein